MTQLIIHTDNKIHIVGHTFMTAVYNLLKCASCINICIIHANIILFVHSGICFSMLKTSRSKSSFFLLSYAGERPLWLIKAPTKEERRK